MCSHTQKRFGFSYVEVFEAMPFRLLNIGRTSQRHFKHPNLESFILLTALSPANSFFYFPILFYLYPIVKHINHGLKIFPII